MKPAKNQVRFFRNGDVEIKGRFLKEEVEGLIKTLGGTNNCNVATSNNNIHEIDPNATLFDSCNDEMVFTVEVTNQILNDFQTLRKTKNEDIRKTLVALMDYYSTYDSLNLILTHDALASRQSYTKYTAQLAQFLRVNQKPFKQVKVQFDPTSSRLGIFCRKTTEASLLNTSFIGTLTAAVKAFGSAQMNIKDIPLSYLSNRAVVKHLLTHRLGKAPKLIWTAEYLQVLQ